MTDNKDKIVSFRVSEETYETLSEIAQKRDTDLSKIFREYVDMISAVGRIPGLAPARQEDGRLRGERRRDPGSGGGRRRLEV
ncbi:MAG: ribbon-helix-helix protein, CopG family, partial [Halobacteria archaeon]|nr:ribbon-helix-helix protein, CopG family [Halobacteria archaeon]